MKRRVIHVASGREYRGGQNQVWLLARALRDFGEVDQTVVTGAGSELERRLLHSDIRVRSAHWRAALDPRAFLTVLSAAREGPAILHAHDAHALTLAGCAARVSGAHLVVTRRVDFHLRRPGFWVRANRVIAISDAVAKILVQDGIRPDRIRVVRSGIALEEVRGITPIDLTQILHLPPDALLAVNVAALVPHKDHRTLVSAAALLRDRIPRLHWAIAGEGPLRSELDRQIGTLGVRDRVHLLGQLPNAARLTAAAHVFVMSSWEEGLGTALLDAMALGVPIVATDAGGIPEVLDGGAGVVTPRGSPSGLADAVEKVLGKPELTRQLVGRARAAVLRFSDRRMAEEVLSVYRSVDSDD